MGISRAAFSVWLTCTILWAIASGVIINAGGFFPAHYQTEFSLREGLEPWQKEWSISDPLHHPLYEIIRSPSAEKLPLQFQYRGYQGAHWNQHVHAREMPSYRFTGGETLDLPAELTDADRDYIKKAFWDQRWERWWDIAGPHVKTLAAVSLCFFIILWGFRQLRVAITGKEPPPERPRLPYSPVMERLRRVTLAVSGVEILFWIVIAVLNYREDPQPILDVLSLMFVIALPALAAFAMSLLHRGPRSAAVLAAFGLYLLLPLLATQFLPRSWLPGG